MAVTIPAINLIATKMASGNVQMLFQRPEGDVRFAIVITATQFTALNTTVNGGSTGATLTDSNVQNANINDYPLSYISGA